MIKAESIYNLNFQNLEQIAAQTSSPFIGKCLFNLCRRRCFGVRESVSEYEYNISRVIRISSARTYPVANNYDNDRPLSAKVYN